MNLIARQPLNSSFQNSETKSDNADENICYWCSSNSACLEKHPIKHRPFDKNFTAHKCCVCCQQWTPLLHGLGQLWTWTDGIPWRLPKGHEIQTNTEQQSRKQKVLMFGNYKSNGTHCLCGTQAPDKAIGQGMLALTNSPLFSVICASPIRHLYSPSIPQRLKNKIRHDSDCRTAWIWCRTDFLGKKVLQWCIYGGFFLTNYSYSCPVSS